PPRRTSCGVSPHQTKPRPERTGRAACQQGVTMAYLDPCGRPKRGRSQTGDRGVIAGASWRTFSTAIRAIPKMLLTSSPPAALVSPARVEQGSDVPDDGMAGPPAREVTATELEGCRRGERESLEAFVRCYERRVFAFLTRMTGA